MTYEVRQHIHIIQNKQQQKNKTF